MSRRRILFENYTPEDPSDQLFRRFNNFSIAQDYKCKFCVEDMKNKPQYACLNTKNNYGFIVCKGCYFEKNYNKIPSVYINYFSLFFFESNSKDYKWAVHYLKSQGNKCYYCDNRAFYKRKGKFIMFAYEKKLNRVHCHCCPAKKDLINSNKMDETLVTKLPYIPVRRKKNFKMH